ncbi:WXG100 family type VII secretion target [Streptacidiphilus sp. ASG 303]|uniref:WXG100 family type VII secretion target n=1 Tax=Streptacidiphilus sp. ASG 303 TaxID=2896847 RepID=UPI001E5FEDFF|nr:WXG100 family type VII secretion target [Streptacidiphilus sp. ASG 303]MCD0484782.1 WXG100 family type VII secretion target [Streptacidiphilus sp. ASG 303]
MSVNHGSFPIDGGTLYKVTIAEVSQGAASCTQTAATVQSHLAELKTYVLGLEADWQGSASNQFQHLMATYDAAAQLLHTALTQIAGGLGGTALNYETAERSAQQHIGTVHIPAARLA